MSSKKNTQNKRKKINKRQKTKKGGERARSTTMCMYSANMDNGANGVYGFHPVWGKNCCNNTNLQSQDVDIITKKGVLGGQPLANIKGGQKNKKTNKKMRKKNKKTNKMQKGGDGSESPNTKLEDALADLRKTLQETKEIGSYQTENQTVEGDGNESQLSPPPVPPPSSQESDSDQDLPPRPPSSQESESDQDLPPGPPSSQESDSDQDLPPGPPSSQESESNQDISPGSSVKEESDTEQDISSGSSARQDDEEGVKPYNEDLEKTPQNAKSGGSKKKRRRSTRKKWKNHRGGNNFASVSDGFNCLVKPWVNNSWTQAYNPIAVSDYPSAPSNILPHTNKYTWNQEG